MKYGLIGKKLGHSFSKEIHTLLGNSNYILREIPEDELPGFMKEAKFCGINVTIPYKQAVIPYLDEISERARAIGAVNTIVNTNGKLYGENTDFYGMSSLIEHLGLNLAGKKLVILGTGGTSKTARAVAKSMHASCVLRVSRSAGNAERAGERVDEAGSVGERAGGVGCEDERTVACESAVECESSDERADVISYEELYAQHTDAQIIINTTPCGMYPNVSHSPIDLSVFSQLEGVIDAIYNPLETRLVSAARSARTPAEGGLYMLVAQALRASELFLNTKYDACVLDKIYTEIYEEKLATQTCIATIKPGVAQGVCAAPPSKSMAHRLLICAGLTQGTSEIRGVDACEDVLATIDCLRVLGVQVAYDEESGIVKINGADVRKRKEEVLLECRESGSTLRFFIPLCLLSNAKAQLRGTQKLMSRPLTPYKEICDASDIRFELSETCTEGTNEAGDIGCANYVDIFEGADVSRKTYSSMLDLEGKLTPGKYILPGNVSSQFVTGLLFALPLLDGDSTIELTGKIESKSYIDMTLYAMSMFGVNAKWASENTLYIEGNQTYIPQDVSVEGDYSNAAFLDAFNMLGGNVTVEGLNPNTLQGDAVYKQSFAALDAQNAVIDLADCPDLGPILMALAALKHGATFTNTARLALKECDRGQAMAQELRKVGVQVEVSQNSINVSGLNVACCGVQGTCCGVQGTRATQLESMLHFCGHNDHRIVMALSVLASVTGGTIDDAQAVAKSFPGFFACIKKLGIDVDVFGMD